MIQRIQSLYLAIAAVASVMLFFFPLADYYNELHGNFKFFIYGLRSMDPEPKVLVSAWFALPLIIFAAVSFLFSVTTIFLYRNRPLQIRINAFNVLVNIVLIMLIFFFYAARIKALTMTEPEYEYAGMVMPLITLCFLILSTRSIRKDEALIRSADRLR
jgi:hypothetical protein